MTDIIASFENDANKIAAAGLAQLSNAQTTINNVVAAIHKAGGPVSSFLTELTGDGVTTVAAVGAAVAAPSAVSIGNAVITVETEFTDALHAVEGFVAGVLGNTAPQTTAAGQTGEAAGAAVDAVGEALKEGLTGAEVAGNNAANKS